MASAVLYTPEYTCSHVYFIAAFFFVKLTGHTYALQQVDKLCIGRSICKNQNLPILQKDIITLDVLEKRQLIQLGPRSAGQYRL